MTKNLLFGKQNSQQVRAIRYFHALLLHRMKLVLSVNEFMINMFCEAVEPSDQPAI